MKIKATLKPHENLRVMDLVKTAGVNIAQWTHSKKGTVVSPASNPAFCYEWAFTEPGSVVVLNVWHDSIRERKEDVWCDINPRGWSEEAGASSTLSPRQRSAASRRAIRMDEAIAEAFSDQLTVRLIVGEGLRRDIWNPKYKGASRMNLRLLDPEPWYVQRYNVKTGQCRLSRGATPLVTKNGDKIPAVIRRALFPDQDLGYPLFSEGAGIKVRVNRFERNPQARKECIARYGLKCLVCTFDFGQVFGSIGVGFIHVHHLVPIATIGKGYVVNPILDLNPVCPNCHGMLHRRSPPFSVDELREIIKKRR